MPAAKSAPKKTATKKAAKPAADKKAAPSHPTYKQMIAVVLQGQGRKGLSVLAISKMIAADQKNLGPRHETALKLALKRGLEDGSLAKVKGLGLAGSFKLAPAVKAAPKKAPAAKKPAAKTAKKALVKKTATKKSPVKKAAKKPAAKKSVPAKKAAKKTGKK